MRSFLYGGLLRNKAVLWMMLKMHAELVKTKVSWKYEKFLMSLNTLPWIWTTTLETLVCQSVSNISDVGGLPCDVSHFFFKPF